MKIEEKQWDSDFFGIKIGRADVTTIDDLLKLSAMQSKLKENFDLLYVFGPHNIEWNQVGAKLVDEKIVYTKQIEKKQEDINVHIYKDKDVCNDLYRLALVSGEYSRYRLDFNLPKGSYEKLYRRWIEQSVNGILADRIFVYEEKGNYVGMITLKCQDKVADIGLVAVDWCMQGRGVGTKILQTLETYIAENTDANQLNVATQWNNTNARAWYEKNGFKVSSITKIWHLWL